MSGIHELHYFDFDRGGRAFALRAAFHAAKQEYKDVRFQWAEFQEMKKEGKYATGVPILKLPSGKEVTQSGAILRYIGKMGGLYPTDLETALICDSIVDTVLDLMAKTPGHDDADEKKRLREEYAAGKMKSYCTVLEDTIEGPYAAGAEFSIADLKLFFFTDMVRMLVLIVHHSSFTISLYKPFILVCCRYKTHFRYLRVILIMCLPLISPRTNLTSCWH